MLVKETLAAMDEKAAQSKRDQDRLADTYSKVHITFAPAPSNAVYGGGGNDGVYSARVIRSFPNCAYLASRERVSREFIDENCYAPLTDTFFLARLSPAVANGRQCCQRTRRRQKAGVQRGQDNGCG